MCSQHFTWSDTGSVRYVFWIVGLSGIEWNPVGISGNPYHTETAPNTSRPALKNPAGRGEAQSVADNDCRPDLQSMRAMALPTWVSEEPGLHRQVLEKY